MKYVLFVLGGERVLSLASVLLQSSLYLVCFLRAEFVLVSLFVVFCVLSVASPPEGQHSDATAAAVDEARETRLTRTLEGDRRQGRKVPRGLGGRTCVHIAFTANCCGCIE